MKPEDFPPKYDPDWELDDVDIHLLNGERRCIHRDIQHRGDWTYQRFVQCEAQATRFYVAKDFILRVSLPVPSIPTARSYCAEHNDTGMRMVEDEYIEFNLEEMLVYEVMKA